jgi:hypothetical protein
VCSSNIVCDEVPCKVERSITRYGSSDFVNTTRVSEQLNLFQARQADSYVLYGMYSVYKLYKDTSHMLVGSRPVELTLQG